MSNNNSPLRETKEVHYQGMFLGSIELGQNGQRLGIAKVARKMRECYPELRNHTIAEYLGVDKRNVQPMIGVSPRKFKGCSSCGKLLKSEQYNSRSRNQGMCMSCRQRRLEIRRRPKMPFLCINCGDTFHKTAATVKWRIKISGRPPMFCGNPCHQSYRITHHIKGKQRCQP